MSELEKSEFDRIWPRIQISKLETARRQLNAAIRSYFLDNDPVPTLTLVGAAYQIVKDLAGDDHKGVVLDNGEEIGDGFYYPFRYPYQSLKHAERKPDEFLDFPTELPRALHLRSDREILLLREEILSRNARVPALV
jgi:hypothetical protein